MGRKALGTEVRVKRAMEMIANGMGVTAACDEVGISNQSYYVWKKRLEMSAPEETVSASMPADTIVGRLLACNLPDADKIHFLRAAYR